MALCVIEACVCVCVHAGETSIWKLMLYCHWMILSAATSQDFNKKTCTMSGPSLSDV